MWDCIRCQPTFPTHFIGACSTFTVLMHRAVITRRSISSRAPAVHLSERACYSVGVVFSTALLWLRGRRSFPSFLYDLPSPPSFGSRSVIGSPLWQRDTRTHTIKVERGRISMSYTQRRGINYSSRAGEFLLYFPSLDMK